MADEKQGSARTVRGYVTLAWASLAVAVSGGAYIAVNSDSGQNRIVSLIETARTPMNSSENSNEYRISNSNLDEQVKVLMDEVRQSRTETGELRQRLGLLEDALGPVTASIHQDTAPLETAALPDATVGQPMPFAPSSLASESPVASIAADEDERGASSAVEKETVISTTAFGLDLAGTESLSEGRALWINLLSQHPEMLARLTPRVAVMESDAGKIELRLIAGPLRNAASVATLCARLKATGQNCRAAVFEGQMLAMR